MNPERARELLRGTTPGPWAFDPEPSIYPIESADGRSVVFQAEDAGMEPVPGIQDQDGHLIAAAPGMAHTIGNMSEEWGVEDRWGYVTWFSPTALNCTPEAARRKAEEKAAEDDEYYLVRRYVTKPELVTEEDQA